jgi:ferredoxin
MKPLDQFRLLLVWTACAFTPLCGPPSLAGAEAAEFKTVDATDEFTAPEGDEFKALDSGASGKAHDHSQFRGEAKAFKWVIGILLVTVAAGILVRYKPTRNLRAVFLVSSIAVLGFYKGGCPCPIQSIQYTILNLFGHAYKWQTLVYFLALIPITYFLGRVYCGWICSLGALQEYMFLGSRFRLFQSERAQVIMRRIRIVALSALVVQLALTQQNLFKKIDPFAVVFNFTSYYTIDWVLVGVLVISSVLIHRPFCKTVCPVGLTLGWVSKLPGASNLAANHTCLSCSTCSQSCRINAITREGKVSRIDNQECIRCGECLEQCRRSSLSIRKNGRRLRHQIELKPAAAEPVEQLVA